MGQLDTCGKEEAGIVTAFATMPTGTVTVTRAVATISTATSYTPYKDVVLAVG